MIETINAFIFPINLVALLVTLCCGFAIGLERQYFGKPAGIRTSILISAGAYIFVALSASLVEGNNDSGRVVGQVVTGIGFLGAGLMFNNGNLVRGVTSASVIWILASIGCLIGFSKYGAAITITLFTLFVLVGISFLEKKFKNLKQGNHSE